MPKAVLVYPPFSWPTAIPLGVSYLKGYIQKELINFEIKVLDRNVDFFSSQLQLKQDLCRLCPKFKDPDSSCIAPGMYLKDEKIFKVINLLRKEKTYGRKTEFYKNYRFFRSFYDQIMACYRYLLKRYVQDYLEDKDIENLLRLDIDEILRNNPDIIGFSVSQTQLEYSLALSKIIKQKTNIPVVFGGSFSNGFSSQEVMRAFPWIDFIVYKEGEIGFKELLNNYKRGDLAKVANLVFRNGRQIKLNREEYIADLDELPIPNFDDLDLNKYLLPEAVIPLIYSRGCYWKKCSFCTHHGSYSASYRHRSADSLIAEILARKKQFKAKYFLFCDEQIPAKKLNNINNLLIKKGISIKYGLSGFRPSVDVDRFTLKNSYRAGCRWIYFGVESYSQSVLNAMHKGTSSEHAIRVIRWCRELGIIPYISYIWGFPTQTRDNIIYEADLVNKSRGLLTITEDGNIFEVNKGSSVAASPEKFKVILDLTPPIYASPTGSVSDIKINFRVQTGLRPNSARDLFASCVKKTKFEAAAFWEYLILLSSKGRRLLFFRKSYLKNLEVYPELWLRRRIIPKTDKQRKGIAEANLRLGQMNERLGNIKGAFQMYRLGLKYLPESRRLKALFYSTLARLELKTAGKLRQRPGSKDEFPNY